MNKEFVSSRMKKHKSSARDVVISGLLIALVFVCTEFINIRFPISIKGGLVHFGDVALFISAIIFGREKGAVAGAVGMGLFDILSGWAAWAPFTFVIRGVMGYIIGSISYSKNRNGSSVLFNSLGIILASIWMIVGYYFTEVILYGNWLAPFTSIPGNIAQLVIGVVFGLPICTVLKKNRVIGSLIEKFI